MTDKPLKRPRDPAQLAKLMIDIASGEKIAPASCTFCAKAIPFVPSRV
jgi:hypothetical protein